MSSSSSCKQIRVYTDGASRDNPGLAGAGVHIVFTGCRDNLGQTGAAPNRPNQSVEHVTDLAVFLGTKTNNEAEYQAALLALEWLQRAELVEVESIELFLDSQLVVNQLNHDWKIKEPRLHKLATKCWEIIKQLPTTVSFTHVPREQNQQADWLANQAIDHFLLQRN